LARITEIEIQKEENCFSAGHFTIFSSKDREDLHGHNYYVGVSMKVLVTENGLAFDYRDFKKHLKSLCKQLNLKFILPKYSKFLKLEETPDMWLAHFDNEKIPFLKRDVIILPIENATIEDLSNWLLNELTKDQDLLDKFQIKEMTVKVYNGPGQSAATTKG